MQNFGKFFTVFLFLLVLFIFDLSSEDFFLNKASGEETGGEIDQNAIIERRAKLERELNDLENQINNYRSIIQVKQDEAASLKRDISIYNAKVGKAKLEIRRLDLEVSNIAQVIQKQLGQIDLLSGKTEEEKKSLAELIRKSNELDSTSLAELVLGYEQLSDFFVVSDTFETIHRSIQNSLDEIRSTQQQLEIENDRLENKKSERIQLKTAQELERKRLGSLEKEKSKLLEITKGAEKVYQAIVTTKQKDAATIRSQLFLLSGSPSIPFERAVEYANFVWNELKIRQAFLLGIIAEESNLGANVGTGNWKADLSHSKCAKQRTAFVEITSELGLDPDLMPVSKKTWYGYCGGAMGPAQFIPTTWQLYKNNISKITGSNPPNPWDPKTAFVAAGLLLKDNGAVSGNYAAERKAALRYLAGSNWNKPSYSFYGDDVMDLATKYQEQIDIISRN